MILAYVMNKASCSSCCGLQDSYTISGLAQVSSCGTVRVRKV